MNLLARKDAKDRLDEIVLSDEQAPSKYINQSKAVNIQIVEFSPNGQMVALGLKSGYLLIVDYLTMGIVRVFCHQEDFGLAANEDIDQFYPFWKLSFFLDDDFVFRSRPQEKDAKCESFLNEKYATRKAKDQNAEIPFKIHLHDVKSQQATKTSIANISWGNDRNQHMIGATFKQFTQSQSQQQ